MKLLPMSKINECLKINIINYNNKKKVRNNKKLNLIIIKIIINNVENEMKDHKEKFMIKNILGDNNIKNSNKNNNMNKIIINNFMINKEIIKTQLIIKEEFKKNSNWILFLNNKILKITIIIMLIPSKK